MELLKGSKEFARNPLGIVALFISLIYGFASLLLGVSADKLLPVERWPLLLFIVIFPFAVLFVFYKLVTEHHGKLYSPGDYKNDDSFLRTLSPEEKDKKLENEAKEATGDVFIEDTSNKKPKNLLATKNNINKAEKFVIQQLTNELNITPKIDIKVGNKENAYDAVFIQPNKSITILEVKYYSAARITFTTVEEFLHKAKATSEEMKIDTKFILALVLDGNDERMDKIADAWSYSIENSGLNIELRIFQGSDINA